MKIHALLSCLLFPVALATLISCEDHREGIEPTRYRLKKTVRTTAYRADTKDTTTIVYTYDTQGKLSNEAEVATSTYGNERFMTNSRFTYDAQSRLMRIDIIRNSIYTIYDSVDRIEYTYDSAGNIIMETVSSDFDRPHTGHYLVTGKTEFTYNGSLFPATITNIRGTSSYTYLNGNINSIGYEYDDKPNPYYGVIRSGGIQPQIFNLNNQRENLVTEPKRILTYNTMGLLVRLNITYRPNPPYNYDQQTTYEYEAY